MNCYYDFHSKLPEQQLRPLIGWCMDVLTSCGETGSYDLRPFKADPDYWILSIEVWDMDNWDESIVFPVSMIGQELTDSWLVLLTEARDGHPPVLDLTGDGEERGDGDFHMELSEVICHLITPDSIAKSWGDGRHAIVFNKKDYAHVPICNALKGYDPTAMNAKQRMNEKQLSLFPEENKNVCAAL